MYGHGCLQKDRNSAKPPSKDISRTLSKNDELEGSLTPLGSPTDLAKQEPGSLADSVPKYFE